jgi:conjugal transfer pilus assembly protein TraI
MDWASLKRWISKPQGAPSGGEIGSLGQRMPQATVRPVVLEVVSPASSTHRGVPTYPPVDTGILIQEPDDLVASHKDLLALLRRNVGLSGELETWYMAPLVRAAKLINALPATRDAHHNSAGGLFRLCLTMAVRSEQSAGGRIFAAGEEIELRRGIESGWRKATFLTGLCVDLVRPLTTMVVVNPNGDEWSPFVESLTDFAARTESSRFFVRWRVREDAGTLANTLGAWAVNHVVGSELLAQLHAVKPGIVEAMFGVCNGSIAVSHGSSLASVIHETRRRVIERDRVANVSNYGKVTTGSHLEPYLLDAMRTLVRTGAWAVNKPGARVHWGTDGMYIAWRSGAKELIAKLQSDGVSGVPVNADTLTEILGRAGAIEMSQKGDWLFLARGADNGATFAAIKIASPQLIVGDADIHPVEESLLFKQAATPATATATVTAPPPAPAAGAAETSQPAKQPEATEKVPPTVPSPSPEKAESVAPPDVEPAVPTDIGSATASSSAVPPVEASPKPSSRAKTAPKPGKGALRPVEEVDEPVDDFPPELLIELSAPVVRTVMSWRDKWNRGAHEGLFLRTPHGLAIASSLLQQSDVALTQIVDVLKAAGHLMPTQQGGRTAFFAKLTFPTSKEELGIVLLTAFAKRCGFTLE